MAVSAPKPPKALLFLQVTLAHVGIDQTGNGQHDKSVHAITTGLQGCCKYLCIQSLRIFEVCTAACCLKCACNDEMSSICLQQGVALTCATCGLQAEDMNKLQGDITYLWEVSSPMMSGRACMR